MPTFTQTLQCDSSWRVNGSGGEYVNTTSPGIRRGNNVTHAWHMGLRWYLRGENNNTGVQINFTPEQVTKVEVRYRPNNTWHINGAAYHSAETLWVVPASSTSIHIQSLYNTYWAGAANAKSLTNYGTNWPTQTTTHEPWIELDDGTDLRSAFADAPTWNTGTDDTSGAVHFTVALNTTTSSTQTAGGYFWYCDGKIGASQPAELRITYEDAPDLELMTGGSLSGSTANESVNLRGVPECAARWYGDKPELQDVYEPVIPYQTGGSGDLPPTNITGQVENPLGQGWLAWTLVAGAAPTKCRPRMSATMPPGTHPAWSRSLYMENYSGCRGYWHWDCDYYRSSHATRPLSTASMILSVQHINSPRAGDGEPIAVEALKDGVVVWRVYYRGHADTGFPNYYPLWMSLALWHADVDGSGAGWTGWTNNRYTPGPWHRWEVQVSNDATGAEIQARLYLDSSTSPVESLSLACPDVTFDEIRMGSTKLGIVNGVGSTRYGNIEVWDDYYLNGRWKDESRKGEVRSADHWDIFEFNGLSDFTELDYAGVVTQETPLQVDETNLDQFDLADFYAERWAYTGTTATPADLAYNEYTLNYSNQGSARHAMTLYTPKGTPPSNGYDTIVWLHGGFFVSGDRSQISKGFVMDCINRGYAVASIDIILSSFLPVRDYVDPFTTSGPYPSWNVHANTARHPTQILDFKLACTCLQDQAQKTAYNLSGKIIASGHSAGGYPAAAAMITRGLTADDYGQDYTLAGNNVAYGYPNIPDPVIEGAYVTAAPSDLRKLEEKDSTRLSGLTYAGMGRYINEVTMQLYFGLNNFTDPPDAQVDAASLPSLIANSGASVVKPFYYAAGRSDYLVPPVDAPGNPGQGQGQGLIDAYAAIGKSSDFWFHWHSEALHYQMPQRYESDHFFEFLKSL